MATFVGQGPFYAICSWSYCFCACIFPIPAIPVIPALPVVSLEFCASLLFQVQFWQDRPQLFAKMSKPHTFGFTLYRAAGGAMQPVQQFNVTRDSRHAPERLPQLQALRLQAQGHASGTGVWARLMACLLPLHHSWQMPCRSCMPTMAPAATTMYRAPGQSAQCMFVGTSCVGACATTVQRHVNGS